jgi:transcriptional regulator with XRE-family HTH domain
VTARAERLFVVSLGERIRFLRRLRRLTTRELATRSGMAPSTVNAVELGVRVPSAVVLLRLAAALQVPWVALVEPAQEEAERMLREAWAAHGLSAFPPAPAVPLRRDRAEGLPS